MYEYLNKNDLNSFDSYIGLGMLNGLSVGNLGLLYRNSDRNLEYGRFFIIVVNRFSNWG